MNARRLPVGLETSWLVVIFLNGDHHGHQDFRVFAIEVTTPGVFPHHMMGWVILPNSGCPAVITSGAETDCD